MLGYEILFYTEIDSYFKVFEYIFAFKQTILNYNRKLDEKHTEIIRCKGTLWLAGFPVSNIETSFLAKEDIEITDFIGPSIDTGFRVSKFSSKRKMCLSVETALLLCDALSDIKKNKELKKKYLKKRYIPDDFDFTIRFEGKEVLKGVLNNTPYPIFWVDMTENNKKTMNIDALEDKWLGKGVSCDYKEVVEYCKKYIEQHEKYIFPPFINSNFENKYNNKPKDFDQRKETAIKAREKDTSDEPKDEGKNQIKFDDRKIDEIL